MLEFKEVEQGRLWAAKNENFSFTLSVEYDCLGHHGYELKVREILGLREKVIGRFYTPEVIINNWPEKNSVGYAYHNGIDRKLFGSLSDILARAQEILNLLGYD